MKRLVILLLVIICGINGYCQPPIQRSTSAVTVVDSRNFSQLNYRPPVYDDTTQANLAVNIGLDSVGCLIYTRDYNGYWFRAASPKRWLQVIPGGSSTSDSIYWKIGGNDLSLLASDQPHLGSTDSSAINFITNSQIRATIAAGGIIRNASTDLKNLKYDTATKVLYYYDDGGSGGSGITSLSQGFGMNNSANPITTTGTVAVDSGVIATRNYVDSFYNNVEQLNDSTFTIKRENGTQDTIQILTGIANVIDSLRRLPGSTIVQALKNGVWISQYIDSVGGGGGGGLVQSVTGFNIDNTDPLNPIVLSTSTDLSILGDGTLGNPFRIDSTKLWRTNGNTGSGNTFGTTDNNKVSFLINNIPYGYFGNGTWFTSSIGIGYNTLDGNTGTSNFAFGHKALGSGSLSGNGNVAIGSAALYSNTTGNLNVAVGTGLGNNTTGSSNISVGASGVLLNNNGDRNIAIGTNSMTSITSGTKNLGIGYASRANSATSRFAIAIGDSASASSNQLAFADSIKKIKLRGLGKGVSGYVLTDTTGNGDFSSQPSSGGGGGGTVTTVSRTNGYGISASVANPTTTPDITIAIDSATVFPQIRATIPASSTDTSNLSDRINSKVNISDTASMLNSYLRKLDTANISNRINLKVNISDTAAMLSPYLRKVDTTAMLLPYFRKVDTTAMLLPYLRKADTTSLSSRINSKLNISDTTVFLRKGTWTDYSGTSTITGWSSYTTKLIQYEITDKIMRVMVQIEGTGSGATTSFTLPLNASAWGTQYFILQTQNNTTQSASVATVSANGNTVTVSNSASTTPSWSNAVLRNVRGQFFINVQ